MENEKNSQNKEVQLDAVAMVQRAKYERKYDDEKRQNTSRRRKTYKEESSDTIHNANRQSRRSFDEGKPRKKKKNISQFDQFKRDLKFFSLGVTVAAAGIGIAHSEHIRTHVEEASFVTDMLDDYYELTNENKHILKDASGKPQFNEAGDVLYYFDTSDIGVAMKEKIEAGVSEAEVVYGVYSTMVNNSDDRKQFYKAMDIAGLPSEEDVWANTNGYESMNDKALRKDVGREVARTMKIQEYHNENQAEVGAMLEDLGTTTNSSDKAMGGK